MKVKIKVWRQKGPESAGGFQTYETPALSGPFCRQTLILTFMVVAPVC